MDMILYEEVEEIQRSVRGWQREEIKRKQMEKLIPATKKELRMRKWKSYYESFSDLSHRFNLTTIVDTKVH